MKNTIQIINLSLISIITFILTFFLYIWTNTRPMIIPEGGHFHGTNFCMQVDCNMLDDE